MNDDQPTGELDIPNEFRLESGPQLSPLDVPALVAEVRRLRAEKSRLAEAIVDTCWKVTPYGNDADGFVTTYIVPAGTVHRLTGTAQCVGIRAPFRAAPRANG